LLQKHPLVATATAVAAARHSPPPQPRSLRGFIVVVSSSSLPSPLSHPPLFCDLFDCCVCSVVVSSPLPHPVVAILPTASAIVIVVVVVVIIVVIVAVVIVVVTYYPPLRVICLIVVCMSIAISSCSLLVRLLPLPNRDKSDRRSLSLLSLFISVFVLLLARGASPAGRSSLRQTSDDDDTTTNRPLPSHSAVVVVASSSPPRGGHFRVTPSAHSSHEWPVDAFPPFVAQFA